MISNTPAFDLSVRLPQLKRQSAAGSPCPAQLENLKIDKFAPSTHGGTLYYQCSLCGWIGNDADFQHRPTPKRTPDPIDFGNRRES